MKNDEQVEFMGKLKDRAEGLVIKEEVTQEDLEKLCRWIEKEFQRLFTKDVDTDEVRGILAVMGAADMAKSFDDQHTIKVVLSKGLERLRKELEAIEDEED